MQLRSRGRRTPPELIPVQVGTPHCALPDDATILAEARTMYIRVFSGDWIAYYTSKRWIGWANWHCMYLSNWDTALCEAIYLAYQDLKDEEERRARGDFASEAVFVAHIAQQLQSNGWQCRQEVRTRYGRIDLLATRETVTWIIEAKLSMRTPDVTCALGQLLCGNDVYPEAILWFATPARIQSRWMTLFARYHITILEGPWTKAV
jgi:hypothetical protein